jgi:hypothetical protein
MGKQHPEWQCPELASLCSDVVSPYLDSELRYQGSVSRCPSLWSLFLESCRLEFRWRLVSARSRHWQHTECYFPGQWRRGEYWGASSEFLESFENSKGLASYLGPIQNRCSQRSMEECFPEPANRK